MTTDSQNVIGLEVTVQGTYE